MVIYLVRIVYRIGLYLRMGKKMKTFVFLNKKKNFTLYSNTRCEKDEIIQNFIVDMVFLISTVLILCWWKDNDNQLICILCILGIMWTCGSYVEIYRISAGRVFSFPSTVCCFLGEAWGGVIDSPIVRNLINIKIIPTGQNKPHPSGYCAYIATKKLMSFRESMQALAFSVIHHPDTSLVSKTLVWGILRLRSAMRFILFNLFSSMKIL